MRKAVTALTGGAAALAAAGAQGAWGATLFGEMVEGMLAGGLDYMTGGRLNQALGAENMMMNRGGMGMMPGAEAYGPMGSGAGLGAAGLGAMGRATDMRGPAAAMMGPGPMMGPGLAPPMTRFLFAPAPGNPLEPMAMAFGPEAFRGSAVPAGGAQAPAAAAAAPAAAAESAAAPGGENVFPWGSLAHIYSQRAAAAAAAAAAAGAAAGGQRQLDATLVPQLANYFTQQGLAQYPIDPLTLLGLFRQLAPATAEPEAAEPAAAVRAEEPAAPLSDSRGSPDPLQHAQQLDAIRNILEIMSSVNGREFSQPWPVELQGPQQFPTASNIILGFLGQQSPQQFGLPFDALLAQHAQQISQAPQEVAPLPQLPFSFGLIPGTQVPQGIADPGAPHTPRAMLDNLHGTMLMQLPQQLPGIGESILAGVRNFQAVNDPTLQTPQQVDGFISSFSLHAPEALPPPAARQLQTGFGGYSNDGAFQTPQQTAALLALLNAQQTPQQAVPDAVANAMLKSMMGQAHLIPAPVALAGAHSGPDARQLQMMMRPGFGGYGMGGYGSGWYGTGMGGLGGFGRPYGFGGMYRALDVAPAAGMMQPAIVHVPVEALAAAGFVRAAEPAAEAVPEAAAAPETAAAAETAPASAPAPAPAPAATVSEEPDAAAATAAAAASRMLHKQKGGYYAPAKHPMPYYPAPIAAQPAIMAPPPTTYVQPVEVYHQPIYVHAQPSYTTPTYVTAPSACSVC